MASDPRRRAAAMGLAGLMLAGYGALVLVGVLPHDAPVAGALSLALGLGLLAAGIGLPKVGAPRAALVGLLGAACAGATLGYAAAKGSGLSGPEIALVVYGAALMAAALALDRPLPLRRGRWSVGTLVGWSFPLVLAPLALFAVNGLVSDPGSGNVAGPVIEPFIVAPTAQALRWSGVPVDQVGSTMLVPTDRGRLSLDVGLVCAGLYPAVMFGGLVALQGWSERMPPRRLAAVLAAGLAGLWLLNVLRMVLLARIGMEWGMHALQTAHANLGWALFAGFMAVFWRLVPRGSPATPAATPDAVT